MPDPVFVVVIGLVLFGVALFAALCLGGTSARADEQAQKMMEKRKDERSSSEGR